MKDKRILVVDDDKNLIDLITQVLSIYNITYDTACSGVDAFEKIKQNFYHMIISDVKMPKMDGIELLNKIREFQKDSEQKSKVTLMTAYASSDIITMANHKGMDYLLEKPFEISSLVEHIKKTLQEL